MLNCNEEEQKYDDKEKLMNARKNFEKWLKIDQSDKFLRNISTKNQNKQNLIELIKERTKQKLKMKLFYNL